MPGVADQIRRTQLRQEQQSRRGDMAELLAMVKENRLHEADERQLENLKLALELNKLFDEKKPTIVKQGPDSEELLLAIRTAISEGMSGITIQGDGAGIGVNDPQRPEMRHVYLADLVQSGDTVDISHKTNIGESVEGESADEKLKKLKEITSGRRQKT